MFEEEEPEETPSAESNPLLSNGGAQNNAAAGGHDHCHLHRQDAIATENIPLAAVGRPKSQ